MGRNGRAIPMVALLVCCSAARLSAGMITVGTVNSFSDLPFSAEGLTGTSRYQQIYSASAFPGLGPIVITSFSINVGANTTSNLVDTGTFNIFFSTTSIAVNGLSTNFASNLGLDNQLFGTYTLSGTVPNTLVFTASNPFAYNPGGGNLLMDVLISNVTTANHQGSSLIYYSQADVSGSITSSAWNAFLTPEATSFGLVTTFTTAPEPATSILITIPLALMWLRKQRRV